VCQAPKIVDRFRERMGATRFLTDAQGPTQKGISGGWQMLTIGPRSEWHQAVALYGNEVHPFSVRSPLILPWGDTAQIRPYFRGSVVGDVLPRQPTQSSPDPTVCIDPVSPPAAFLEVVAYDDVPSVFPFARPDMEYVAPFQGLGSTEAVHFSCPVMGRRKLSVYFKRDDEEAITARFTGCWFEDDTLRETEIRAAEAFAFNAGAGTTSPGDSVSLHLDLESDAFLWVKMYAQSGATGISHFGANFLVRD